MDWNRLRRFSQVRRELRNLHADIDISVVPELEHKLETSIQGAQRNVTALSSFPDIIRQLLKKSLRGKCCVLCNRAVDNSAMVDQVKDTVEDLISQANMEDAKRQFEDKLKTSTAQLKALREAKDPLRRAADLQRLREEREQKLSQWRKKLEDATAIAERATTDMEQVSEQLRDIERLREVRGPMLKDASDSKRSAAPEFRGLKLSSFGHVMQPSPLRTTSKGAARSSRKRRPAAHLD